ncbi:hypothetical protein EDB85DRAFT_1891935 [Lactarius pseudohatsudake]|nr:hypothetical protein EDB85DRAFT_1891935 [Lactarius pseudohatsudake]
MSVKQQLRVIEGTNRRDMGVFEGQAKQEEVSVSEAAIWLDLGKTQTHGDLLGFENKQCGVDTSHTYTGKGKLERCTTIVSSLTPSQSRWGSTLTNNRQKFRSSFSLYPQSWPIALLEPQMPTLIQAVEEDKQKQVAAKVQADKLKATKTQGVAEFEKAEKRKTRDMDQQANNPVDKISQPKAKRTRDLPKTVNNDLGSEHEEETPAKKMRTRKSTANTLATSQNLETGSGTQEVRVDGLEGPGKRAMFEDNNPKFAALRLEESESSGSEYKAPVGSDGSESESAELDTELDDGPELEGDEPDTNIQLKAGKKQKKGQIARDQIGAAAAINEEPSPFADSKRPTASKSGQTPG